MEAIRFCKNIDGTEYFKLPEYVETCKECEWYYPKPEADAVIARRDHQIEVLNADLTRCHESKTAIGDKCLRLESENAVLREEIQHRDESEKICLKQLADEFDEVDVLRERLTRCTQDNFELCQDSAILQAAAENLIFKYRKGVPLEDVDFEWLERAVGGCND